MLSEKFQYPVNGENRNSKRNTMHMFYVFSTCLDMLNTHMCLVHA